jgi:hypothetical protein
VPFDLTAGSCQEYVEVHPVCCCPNVLHVEVDDRDGNGLQLFSSKREKVAPSDTTYL